MATEFENSFLNEDLGPSDEDWDTIAKEMNISLAELQLILIRHKVNKPFTLREDRKIVEFVTKKFNVDSLDVIKSITWKDFPTLKHLHREKEDIGLRFERHLKPIILEQIYGEDVPRDVKVDINYVKTIVKTYKLFAKTKSK